MFVNLLHANLALVLAALSGYVIPAVSALLTRRPSALTGVITTVLSAAAGFIAEWAASSDVNSYDWRAGLNTAATALLLAFLGHKITWEGPAAAVLHSKGVAGEAVDASTLPPATPNWDGEARPAESAPMNPPPDDLDDTVPNSPIAGHVPEHAADQG